MSFAFASTVVTILAFVSLGQGIWIESPKVTNWGEWGPEEYCNQSHYVTGFRLKVQQNQGIILDDTALNGIELHCIPNVPGEGERKIVTSRVGVKGAWGGIKECDPGSYGVGFEMRTEEPTLFDNTAGNNMRLYCSDGNVLEGVGMDWGIWTGPLFCPNTMKICGMRTQVEDPVETPPLKGGTGINNVDMWCCDRHDNRVLLSKKF